MEYATVVVGLVMFSTGFVVGRAVGREQARR
jgi:hypothetical protein